MQDPPGLPTFFELFGIVRRYWLFISGITTLSVLIAGLMVFFVITPTYQATTSLLLQGPSNNSSLSNLVNQLETQLDGVMPLRSVLGQQRGGSSVGDLISILKSYTLAHKVAAKVPLKQLPELQKILEKTKPDLQERILTEYLQQHLIVYAPDSRDATLRISIRLPDKKLPAILANQYVKELEAYVRTLVHKDTLDYQGFLERQLKEMEGQLTRSEEDLLGFQKRNRTVSLTEEIKQYIKYVAELEADELTARTALRENQARLNALAGQSTELNPNWSEVTNQLEINQQALQDRQQELSKARKKYEGLLATLPNQALNLARLERQVTLKNRLYLLLSQQVQALKLDASRTPPLFKVLDPAIAAHRPVAPVKKVVVAVSGMIAIGLGVLLALIHYYSKHLKSPSEKENQDVTDAHPDR